MQKTKSARFIEAWYYPPNKVLEIVNRKSGKVQVFRLESEIIDERFMLGYAGDDPVLTSEYYGHNGFRRMRKLEEST